MRNEKMKKYLNSPFKKLKRFLVHVFIRLIIIVLKNINERDDIKFKCETKSPRLGTHRSYFLMLQIFLTSLCFHKELLK